ncbi:MAG TPA: ABC transporter permease [Nocardioidaceae bacterium]|nr:ABC transporter permease [Nocardioidaceae bacterium]
MTMTPTTQDAGSQSAGKSERSASARQRAGRVGYGLLGALVVLGAWYFLAVTELFGPGQTPRPDEVAAAGWAGFTSEGMLFDVRVSITRVLIGVALGAAMAVPVGFLLAWYPRLRATFDPLVNFFRALPPIALIPLFIVYFGIGETARISILVYAAFFASVVVLYEGISSLDPLLIRASKVLGANSWEVFAKCVVPAAVPHLFTGLRVAFGVSWATLVAAELLAANRGLGAVIQNARTFFQIPDIYVGIVLIGLSALVMDYLLRVVQRYATRWQERTQR